MKLTGKVDKKFLAKLARMAGDEATTKACFDWITRHHPAIHTAADAEPLATDKMFLSGLGVGLWLMRGDD